MKKIKVVELFAGVGGFRIGLEGFEGKSASTGYNKKYNSPYEVVWSNQYEPSTKEQHASNVYKKQWPNSNHSGKNIEDVIENNFNSIVDHDLLVGGFPCQDYSVATTLKRSKGLIGKKGVLWWSIYSIIKNKGKKKPKYLLLENVDRLLVSPSSQRGRDFAVILSCLYEQGYGVEWRVINAAEYGTPQKRKRVYLLAYHESTKLYKLLKKNFKEEFIKNNVLAKAFPIDTSIEYKTSTGKITKNQKNMSANFNKGKKMSPFLNAGIMIEGKFHSIKSKEKYKGDIKTLGSILDPESVNKEFYIDNKKPLSEIITKVQRDRKQAKNGSIKRKDIVIKTELDMWKYLKGTKNEIRINRDGGFEYNYDEGSMTFPDDLDKPSRTIITGEGGGGPSRFKHVVKVGRKYRRLTPIELERLNMFPDKHTELEGVSDSKRAFFMGNALVIGIVERIGKELIKTM